MALAVAAAQTAWMLGNIPAGRRFQIALRDPQETQRMILASYLRKHAGTLFGQRHHFATISSPHEFQRRVPISHYEDYRGDIARIAAGEQNVLTRQPVRYFALSSGSASAEKWIPYTPSLIAEFGRAIAPWMTSLYRVHPRLRGGPAYWSITPVGPRPLTESRVPVGFDEDSAYLGGMFKRIVDATFAVPGELRHVQDMETFRYLTLVCLLRARDLRLISVWHPSFFTLLLDAARPSWDRLLQDIRAGSCSPPGQLSLQIKRALARRAKPDPARAAELKAVGPANPAGFWPQLSLISCWADAHARTAAARLAALFPQAALQGKGLLATEGCISIPFTTAATTYYPLAIRSHFFEFLPEEGDPVFAEDADIGGTYSIVLTTAGGLYRYHTGDRVRITGRLHQTPCLEFLGKSDQVSDRFGEKLNALFVGEMLAELQREMALTFDFVMLAPDGPGYTLFFESPGCVPVGFAAMLDERLSRNPHYAYCRSLGQLAAARLFLVECGAHYTYLETCRAKGQRLGNIKPTALHGDTSWASTFEGRYVEA